MSQLKGHDYHRARHLAQSCVEHSDFFLLLANMELHIKDPNSEDSDEKEFCTYLTRVTDLNGFDLLLYKTLVIPDTALLQEDTDERVPDVQRGGEYWGNQYLEIDQFFKDSV